MKFKYLILLLPLIMTGCLFGEVGSGFTTKICTRETSIDDITLIEEKVIKQKENNVVSIVFTNKIVGSDNSTFQSLKNSYLSEANNLKGLGVIVNAVEDVKNEYSVSYEFDVSSISEELKNKYQFEDLYHNQLKKYESDGYKCE